MRRGLSIALRPCEPVLAAVNGFQHQLAEAGPDQYFYRPAELHVTVLAIIPGSESWRDRFQPLAAYQSVLRAVLDRHRPFTIAFRGVTASRGGVMIQGFPQDDTLAGIRNDLRQALRQHRLGDQLDARYKINTAHMTVMRFCNANLDGKRLLALLQANRATDFGVMTVANLELVLCDWYASADTASILAEYQLTA